jgi:hypothetical protein
MENDFKDTLISLGFSCNTQPKKYSCPHLTQFNLFVQDSIDHLDTGNVSFDEYIKTHNKSKYLNWEKRPCCLDCLNSMLDNLSCGGWYNNLRIMNSLGKDVTYEYWSDYLDVLDPNQIIWEEDILLIEDDMSL